jgi:hypothetical protein
VVLTIGIGDLQGLAEIWRGSDGTSPNQVPWFPIASESSYRE